MFKPPPPSSSSSSKITIKNEFNSKDIINKDEDYKIIKKDITNITNKDNKVITNKDITNKAMTNKDNDKDNHNHNNNYKKIKIEHESNNTKSYTTSISKTTNSIQASRLSLPIYEAKDLIIKTILENNMIVIVGETGSGKTTQIPQFLLSHGLKIAVTQPRRYE